MNDVPKFSNAHPGVETSGVQHREVPETQLSLESISI